MGLNKILSEQDMKNDMSPLISDLLDNIIVSNNEDVCKIKVTAPWNRETKLDGDYKHYKVLVYFIGGYNTKNWPRTQAINNKEEEIMNEIWDTVYDFMGIAVDLYSKRINKCNKNLQEEISRIQSMMGVLTETRKGLMGYLSDKTKELTGIEWPEYVIRDWLYRNTKEVGEMNPELYKDLVRSYVESFVEGHGKGHWEYKVLDISIDSFTDFVKEDLKKKMGGFINPHVPKDEERHSIQQSQLEKSGVSPEPIIVVETKYGKYDLLEGWHRTTNALKKFGEYKQNAWVYILE